MPPPDIVFAWLGGLVFVVGWALTIYLVFSIPSGQGFLEDRDVLPYERISTLLSFGTTVTIAAGILWGVAAYIWVRLLRDGPDKR